MTGPAIAAGSDEGTTNPFKAERVDLEIEAGEISYGRLDPVQIDIL